MASMMPLAATLVEGALPPVFVGWMYGWTARRVREEAGDVGVAAVVSDAAQGCCLHGAW